MALENGDFIDDLDPNWPLGSDPVSQGDDHVRLIKKVLVQTFPGLTGPVTATQEELNQGGTPTGGIQMFGGSAAPTGYVICNGAALSRVDFDDLYIAIGTTYGEGDGSTTFNVPNMTDRVAAGPTVDNPLGALDGKNVWTAADLPAHNHTSNNAGDHFHNTKFRQATAQGGTGKTVNDDTDPRTHNINSDAAGTHKHTINNTGSGGDNKQATIYVNFIIKT